MNIHNLTLKPNTIARRNLLQKFEVVGAEEIFLSLPHKDFTEMFDLEESEVFCLDFIATIMSFSHYRRLISSTYATSTILTREDVNQILLTALYLVVKDGDNWHEVRSQYFSTVRQLLQSYRNNTKDWNGDNIVDMGELDDDASDSLIPKDYSIAEYKDLLTDRELAILFRGEATSYDEEMAIKMKIGYAKEPTEAQLKEAISVFPTYGYRRICTMLSKIPTVAVTNATQRKLRSLIEG